jgi:hypothetical protein
LLGLWAGLVGGLGEGAAVQVARYGFHRYVFRRPDVLWMAPVSLAVLCGLAAIPLALGAARQWRGNRSAVAFFVFGLLALLNTTPEIPKIPSTARLILLAGIAAAASRFAATHQETVWCLVRASRVPVLALVVLLAIGAPGNRWLQERRALAALPAAAAGAPNVLLLILDTVRAMDLGIYGYARATSPALDRVGRRGVVFERVYAPAHGPSPVMPPC